MSTINNTESRTEKVTLSLKHQPQNITKTIVGVKSRLLPIINHPITNTMRDAHKKDQSDVAIAATESNTTSCSILKTIQSFLTSNTFEVFLYTHIIVAYTVTFLALHSRFEVFYAAAYCWGLYALDVLLIKLFTFRFELEKGTEVLTGGNDIKLKLQAGISLFHFSHYSGEIAFVQYRYFQPENTLKSFWLARQWHVFFIANKRSSKGELEFLIQVCGDDGNNDSTNTTWTNALKMELLYENINEYTPFYIRGPFGSSFKNLPKKGLVVLIAGGSGVASSLSILKDLVHNQGSNTNLQCLLIYAAYYFNGVKDIITTPSAGSTSVCPPSFIRVALHVSKKLTKEEVDMVNLSDNTPLKRVLKFGRPNWEELFRGLKANINMSFTTNNASTVNTRTSTITTKTPITTTHTRHDSVYSSIKVYACATKAIYDDIEVALVNVDDLNVSTEFHSDNFE